MSARSSAFQLLLRRLLVVGRIAIGLGLLVYLGVSGVIKGSMLFGLLDAWPLSLAAFALLVLTVNLIAVRLCVLLKPHGLYLPWLSALRLTLIGLFFNFCLPGATGGDVVKIYYATESNPGRRTEVATVMLLDRAVGMFALTLMPLLLAPLFPGLLRSIAILPVLLGGGVALAAALAVAGLVCSMPRLRHSRIVAWGLPKLPFGKQMERMLDTVHVHCRSRGTLFAAVGISFAVHMLLITVVLLIVQAINPERAHASMAMLIPLGFLANALPVTPGGLGVGEAAFDRLFQLAGLTGGAEALLGWRLLMMLIAVGGLIAYVRGGRHVIQRRASSPGAGQVGVASQAENVLEGA